MMSTLKDLTAESAVAFGTSGARGLVDAMTEEVCAGYTQAFIHTVQQQFAFSSVAIAVDLRPSSLSIAAFCASMIEQLGYTVIFCGEIPTPALALYSQREKIPGIMVTGSHIPFDRNGLKFYRPDGEISKADEAAMLETSLLPLVRSAILPEVNLQAKHDYMQRYEQLFGHQPLNGLKVALYQHSSVGRDLMVELLSRMGASVVALERSDTFVPIDTEAVSEIDVQRGIEWANTYDFDAIVSTDGDGDRPLIGDERGHWLRGDIVGLLTARLLGIKNLAVPVSCNTAIEKTGFFNQVVRTRIGSPYVIAAMSALMLSGHESVAGFEANGGFLLGSAPDAFPALQALPTRDAVLPVVVLLAECKAKRCALSSLVYALPTQYTVSDRLQNFPTEKSKALIQIWSEQPKAFLSGLALDDADILKEKNLTDGLRLVFNSGKIIHLRPSGNAPEFRCYIETSDLNSAQSLLQHVLNHLKTFA